jgi:predicted DNA repair protein MutK
MSGLLALLDDVAAIAKVAAASVDDIAAAAAKAGSKTAVLAIDDAAVTPKFMHGFSADRELPIIWRIAKGSIFNKLVILLPAALILSAFAPWIIQPLLMLGGAYLCFEGAEKVYHVLFPHADKAVEADFDVKDPGHLEETRVAGAVKTDFILSAEIMTIALSTIPDGSFWMQAATLAVIGIGMTVFVYGGVALLVKMDDIGLHMAANRRTDAARAFGRGLVIAMPKVMKVLSVVGTAAMLWVGGNIVIHGLEVTHVWAWPYEVIHHIAAAAAHAVPAGQGFVEWLVTATLDGVVGLILGVLLIPVVTRVIGPLWATVTGKKAAAH